MTISNMRIMVTGANGFIGKNLVVRLNELSNSIVSTFVRGDKPALLAQHLAEVDAVIHLAGENRPTDEAAFTDVNTNLTEELCKLIKQEITAKNRYVPIVLLLPHRLNKITLTVKVNSLQKKKHAPWHIDNLVIFRLLVFLQVVQA